MIILTLSNNRFKCEYFNFFLILHSITINKIAIRSLNTIYNNIIRLTDSQEQFKFDIADSIHIQNLQIEGGE